MGSCGGERFFVFSGHKSSEMPRGPRSFVNSPSRVRIDILSVLFRGIFPSDEMPRATRATLAKPVEARFFWCMHCLRTQVKGFKPEADVALEVVCVMDAKASIMCKQCAGRSQPCELVSPTPIR